MVTMMALVVSDSSGATSRSGRQLRRPRVFLSAPTVPSDAGLLCVSKWEMPFCALAFSPEPLCARQCLSGWWGDSLLSSSTFSLGLVLCAWLPTEIVLLSTAAKLYFVSLAILCARVSSSSSVLSALS